MFLSEYPKSILSILQSNKVQWFPRTGVAWLESVANIVEAQVIWRAYIWTKESVDGHLYSTVCFVRSRSSLIRNHKTTGLEDETTQYKALVKLSKISQKNCCRGFSLGHPGLPSASSDGGRWRSLSSVDSLLLHSCVRKNFHFHQKKIFTKPSHLHPPRLPPVGCEPHLVPPAGLQVGQGRGDLHPIKKLSLSDQLASLVHAFGSDLVSTVEGGELPVVDDPILLLIAQVAHPGGRIVSVSSV